MGSTLLAAAKSLPLVLLGLVTHHLLFKNAAELLPSVVQSCPQAATVDKLLCILVNFFKPVLTTSEGLWVTGYIFAILNSVFPFMAVEGSRYGSGWLLSLLPLHAFLFQIQGLAVVLPLVWLPLYFFSGGNDASSSKYGKLRRKVSLGRVVLVALGLQILQFTEVGLMLTRQQDSSLTESYILVFVFAPIVLPLLWILPLRTTDKSHQARGHQAVIALHLLQAGAGLVWQAVAIAVVVGDPGLPGRVFHTLLTAHHHSDPGTWPVAFQVLDTLVVFLALLYVVVLQEGILAGMALALAAPILGPAASLSLYFACRELRLISTVNE